MPCLSQFTFTSCLWTAAGVLLRQNARQQFSEEWQKYVAVDGNFESDEKLREYMERWREYDYLPAVEQLKKASVSLSRVSRFRRTDAPGIKPFNAAQEGGDEFNSQCPNVSVVPPNRSSLKNLINESPVTAAKPAENDDRRYVFITGGAYTGTTGVLGLLSTSPNASNLCSANTICCEGGWLLTDICKGRDSPGDPNYPQDWNDAIRIFENFWDPSKQIFIDKSPSYLFKFSHLYRDLKPKGLKLSFIYVISSPCSAEAQGSPSYDNWADTMEIVAAEIYALRLAGAHVHVIKTEELLGDPLGVTRGLLEFLPALGSLDPTKTGVHDAPYVMEGDARANSLAEYVGSRTSPRKFATRVTLSNRDIDVMTALGYTDEWYSRYFIEKH